MALKKVYDPVHGFIRFNDLESELIDSFPFQRLHYIRQLGIAFLVYPGTTHTRFEHSLGVMELASKIFDGINEKNTFEGKRQEKYWRQIVRLSALCHDLGHLPFSHAAEAALLGKGGHEKWTMQIILSQELAPIWENVQKEFPNHSVKEDILKLSIGENSLHEMGAKYSFSAWERVLCQIITADFFGADRIDYLLRDAQSSGLSYGLFDYHQLIEMLCILPEKDGRLTLGIEENGVESCEALLLARHFMHRRLYQYHSVKAYSFHLSRFMQQLYTKADVLKDLQEYILWNDSGVLSALTRALKDPNAAGHDDAKCLLIRHHRFRAIELDPDVKESDLIKLKKDLNLSDRVIGWSFSTKKMGYSRLSFPVLKRNGEVVDASAFSKISIPSTPTSWVFIDPAYEKALHQALEKS